MPNDEPEDKKKPHRKPHSGRKAEKKTKKNENLKTEKLKNPKAFAFHSAVRAERRFRRTQDLETKKQHIPLVDRTPLEPPPVIVAVVGPPKVGKTTLIQCLIKNFTRQPLTSLKGPVTIVSGKKRRLTIMECNNDINSMIDIAKVADLVLLLVDASFGFEMEIFEFLNICQVHGMPRIMGVLTHLDMLKRNKQLARVKKTLKHRFWTEVYDGAKLFYLSGLLYGEYLRNEVKNLGRFISVIKFRPLLWRTSHPYILVDRLEDITSPEMIRQNPVVNRDICLYGFVRGIPMNKSYSVHIPGCGDFKIKDVMFLPDPCPLPEKEKRRSLVEKEKLIYAPFSGVGGIVYDKDAVYVELAGSHSHSQEEKKSEFVNSLMEVQEPIDKKIAQSELQLFTGAQPITSGDMYKSNRYYEESVIDENGRKRRKVIFTDEEVNGDDNDTDVEEESNDEIDGSDLYENDECDEHMNTEKGESVEEWTKLNSKSNKMKQERAAKVKQNYTWQNGEDNERDKTKIVKSEMKGCDNEEGYNNNMFSGKINSSKITSGYKTSNAVNTINSKLKQLMGDDDDDDYDDDDDGGGDDDDDDDDDNDDDVIEDANYDDGEISSDDIPEGNLQHFKELPKLCKEKMINERENKNFNVTSKIAQCLADLDKKSGYRYENSMTRQMEMEENKSDDISVNEGHGSDYDMEMEQDFNPESHLESSLVEDSAVRWKSNLRKRAADAFFERQANSFSLWKLVYGETVAENSKTEDGEDLGGLFRKVSREQKQVQEGQDLQDGKDSSKYMPAIKRDWKDSSVLVSIADCFVTGKWKESEDAEELLRLDEASVSGESDVYGDFEDLETGEKHVSHKPNENVKDDDKSVNIKDSNLSKKELIEKKKKLKEKFDAEYDEGEGNFSYYEELKQEVHRQSQLNKSEFEGLDDDVRVQLEGFRPGMYVRVELSNMPCELVTHFDPAYPMIIGGLLTGEENVGSVQVRMKKHRWFGKILKNCDPLIVSLGWRRFQTIPVFAKLEDNFRQRYLKYTPEHVACIAHFWGPITPQGTGFLAIQDVSSKEAGFRIAATGSVIELDKSVQVMKKLKLTGVPLKVYRKTAFIRGMFNSALEVAKFEGAKLRTVSGIRGQIKKAVGKPEGSFRATFEDKIKLSDIVFCRTWYNFPIPKLYNPVMTLLLPPEAKNAWKGMKTVGQLKREKGVKQVPAVDSLYTPVHREPKVFKPFVISNKLQRMLPYKDKPKKAVEISARKLVEKKRIAVVHDPREQKISKFIKMLKVSYEHKQELDKKAALKKKQERRKEMEKEEIKLLKRHKELKRNVFRALDKMEQKKKSKIK